MVFQIILHIFVLVAFKTFTMKRLFVVFASAILFAVTASAQLNIKSETSPRVQIGYAVAVNLSDANSTGTYLYLRDGVYFLSSFTSNRFDERMLFKLGETKDAALQTLKDLATLCDGEVGTEYELDRWDGTTCQCIVADRLRHTKKPTNGAKVKGARLIIGADGFAGIVDLSQKDFQTLARYLEKYTEE
ncbi:MAG: hypothetical protein J6W53_01055 [Candidatus Methanomethylophilaceae archaeon]|nr:hypothetical protein [Candidatus Methanomethylophilaceae archaeon]